MNYRKRKKELTKERKKYEEALEANPFNATANSMYQWLTTKLRLLRNAK